MKRIVEMLKSLIRRRMLASLAAAAVGMSIPAAAVSESLMERATGDGLRVAFYNFKPYAFMTESGELTGIDVETLRVVLEQMGGKIANAAATEWGNLIPGLQAKRFDIVAAGMFVTPKRCAAVAFSEPIFGIGQALAVLSGNPHGIVDYDSIAEKGLTVATISGSAHVGYARDSGIEESKILQLPDTATAIAALRADRAQVIAVSAPGVREMVKSVPEQDLEGTPTFSKVAGKLAMPHGAFAFRKADADFVEEFNKILTGFMGTQAQTDLLVSNGMTEDEVPRFTTAELCAG